MTLGEILLGVGSGLLVNEVCDVSPWLARNLVKFAARHAYRDEALAGLRAEEWGAVIDARPGKLFKLGTGIMFMVGAAASASHHLLARETSHVFVTFGDVLVTIARSGSRNLMVYRLLLLAASRLGSASARALLGQLYEMLGDRDSAIEHYGVALDLGVDEVWCRLGGLFEERGQIDAAIELYYRALPQGGCLARAELVRLLERQGRADEALDVWNEWAKDSEEGVPIFVRRALEYRPLMDSSEDLTTRTTTRGLWGTRLWVAGLLEIQGRVPAAMGRYAEDPNDKIAMFRLKELEDRYGQDPEPLWATLVDPDERLLDELGFQRVPV